LQPNPRVQPTPLCGEDAAPILKAEIGSSAFPVYQCGAAKRQAVGRQSITAAAN
jgi:hypothetical protein